MKTVNAMPFNRCRNCKNCVLSVSEHRDDKTGEHIVLVRCKNERKCMTGEDDAEQ